MTEETEKALEDFRKAQQNVDKICCWEEYDPNNPDACLDCEALAAALREEKEALVRYKTLLYTGMGWPQKKIDDWLKRAGLL